MIFAVCFTNFGPYHLARLRALAAPPARERRRPDRLRDGRHRADLSLGTQRGRTSRSTGSPCSPTGTWRPSPGRLRRGDHAGARPRPARRRGGSSATPGPSRWPRPAGRGASGRPAILMSESQAIDHPRVWWKEAIKRRRVRRFDAGAGRAARGTAITWSTSGCRRTGSPWATTRSTTPSTRDRAEAWRGATPTAGTGLPEAPYFLAVSRFVPEKNLRPADRGVRALSRPVRTRRRGLGPGPLRRRPRGGRDRRGHRDERLRRGDPPARASSRPSALRAVVCPSPSAFVHPEPDGAVGPGRQRGGGVRPAAARLGAGRVRDDPGARAGQGTDRRAVRPARRRGDGRRRWPGWPGMPEADRLAMGRRAAEVVGRWGPERFAEGTIEALELRADAARTRATRRRSCRKRR